MSWTAGEDVATGSLITAAQWNNFLGATGSLEYLKTEADRIDDCTQQTQADFTPDRAFDTVYQNTGDGFRLVCVTPDAGGSATDNGQVMVENANPPTTIIGNWEVDDATADVRYAMITFIVPPGWRYKVTHSGASTVEHWTESQLH